MSASSTPAELTISDLFVHPLKSCAALRVSQALVSPTGLQFDREWVVVDAQGEFLSQRECPRMALIQCQLRHSELVLKAPGMLALHLRLDGAESETRVRVWDADMAAFDMGDLPAQWLSDCLGLGGLRLAAFDSEHRRLSEARWSGGVQALNAFSDGFPLLVSSQASLDELNRRLGAQGLPPVDFRRLRPNIVLSGLEDPHGEDHLDTLIVQADEGEVVLKLTKPCTRCAIPDIDPETAVADARIGQTLQRYRSLPRMDGAVAFGMNAVIVSGVGRTLRAGASVRATSAL